MTIVLDTNVVSETTRRAPDGNLLSFLSSLDHAFVSVLTIHELHYCMYRLPLGQRQMRLAMTVDRFLAIFGDAVIDLDRAIARRAGALRADALASGRVLHLADALIAATALELGLRLATGNVEDFAGLGLTVVNPWAAIGA